jgi:hypothetical protein
MVARVGNVNASGARRYRDHTGLIEFAGAGAAFSELAQVRTGKRKVLDPVIVRIADENDVVGAYGDAASPVELAVTRPPLAPPAKVRTGGGEVLDPVVIGIRYVNVAVGGDGDVVR